MTYKYASRTVFVLGAPRSGTTWLGKIFDSHPGVIYRHEPDRFHEEFPFWLDAREAASRVQETGAWLDALAETRRLRAAGKTPLFKKSFESPVQHGTKRLLVGALKLASGIPGGNRIGNSIPIPDFVGLESGAYQKLVIKSIASMQRTRALALAAHDTHFVVILRHPCGQVASMAEGVRASHFERDLPLRALADSPQARRRNLTDQRLSGLSLAGQLAWSWVISNEQAMEGLQSVAHLSVVRYEDLAANPEGVARRLFAEVGLDWQNQTAQFLHESTEASGGEGYYTIRRNPLEAATKWRQSLPAAEIDEICAIAAESEPGRLFAGSAAREAQSLVVSGDIRPAGA